MIHFHRWSNWQDVRIDEKFIAPPLWIFPFTKEVLRQQRRCSICNRVETKS